MTRNIISGAALVLFPLFAFGQGAGAETSHFLLRTEFILFGLTLLGVALFHHHTLAVALTGLVLITGYSLFFTDVDMLHHLGEEWQILLNLLGLLVGFAVLARHFELSGLPEIIPRYLPNDWRGGFMLLVLVFILSSFLDNIAAAMIGGTIALAVFKGKVHLAFIAALVAASNAGGSGSVVGDTTTTMMWIAGIPAISLLPAYFAAIPALLILAWFGSRKQDRHQRIIADAPASVQVDRGRLLIVALILVMAIITNVYFDFPALGVWVALLLGGLIRPIPWHEAASGLKGALFLLALVFSASLMPVDQLPAASWQSALWLGFISSIFDNIPLTKLALEQGGFNWSLLAYCVGFGGSMLWFGSSAGVAISRIFPEARSAVKWAKAGWFIPVAYVVGFFVLLAVIQ